MSNNEKNRYVNIDEQTLEYIGLYGVLDEILKRIEKCTDINELSRYCDMYERMYKLKDFKELKINE